MDHRLLEGFMEAVRDLPGVQARYRGVVRSDGIVQGSGAQVDLRADGEAVTLLIEIRKVAYPRDARQVLWKLGESARGLRRTGERRRAVPFLIAQSISPGTRELLRSERVGYYDSGGSLFVPAGSIYILVDKPSPRSLSRAIRSVYSGRRAQVLHAILQQGQKWFGVKEVAARARASPATVSQVLRELEKFEWVVSRGRGPAKERCLREPGALLDAWVNHQAVMRPLSLRRYFVPTVRGKGLVAKFAEACAASRAEYAVTHEAAGQLYAPFLTTVSQVRCRLLDGPAADEALRALDARPVNGGANLATIEVRSPGELLFRESVNGVWLAGAVQVYLDLMNSEGRARELAQHLRRERIGF